MKPDELKKVVKEKYGEIAVKSNSKNTASCCVSSSCCDETGYTVFSEEYTNLKGYNPEADLNLGCGLPTQYAGIQKGDSVLDLGSGAGNDCFVARSLVGEEGKVTGLDFTDEMLAKARGNARKLAYTNIDFVKGDIEEMPFNENSFDVVISNCVLNLVPDKEKAFTGIYRVLKANGHFCISDVVISGNLPDELKEQATLYAGCVTGALEKGKYLQIIQQTGFKDIQIRKEKPVELPKEILLKYLSEEQVNNFKNAGNGIFSITVTANK